MIRHLLILTLALSAGAATIDFPIRNGKLDSDFNGNQKAITNVSYFVGAMGPTNLLQAGATTNDVLAWDGTNWVARAPSYPTNGVTSTEATNIAAYQALLATNGQAATIAAKAGTNSPTLYVPTIRGGATIFGDVNLQEGIFYGSADGLTNFTASQIAGGANLGYFLRAGEANTMVWEALSEYMVTNALGYGVLADTFVPPAEFLSSVGPTENAVLARDGSDLSWLGLEHLTNWAKLSTNILGDLTSDGISSETATNIATYVSQTKAETNAPNIWGARLYQDTMLNGALYFGDFFWTNIDGSLYLTNTGTESSAKFAANANGTIDISANLLGNATTASFVTQAQLSNHISAANVDSPPWLTEITRVMVTNVLDGTITNDTTGNANHANTATSATSADSASSLIGIGGSVSIYGNLSGKHNDTPNNEYWSVTQLGAGVFSSLAATMHGDGAGLSNVVAKTISNTMATLDINGLLSLGSAITIDGDSGQIWAEYGYYGPGDNLTNLNASELKSGTVDSARLPTYPVVKAGSNVTVSTNGIEYTVNSTAGGGIADPVFTSIRTIDPGNNTNQVMWADSGWLRFGIDVAQSWSGVSFQHGAGAAISIEDQQVTVSGQVNATGQIATETGFHGDGSGISNNVPVGVVPVGGIILWSGSSASIPAKWALCNGDNGTPDLRDKFIIGAGNTYAVGAGGGSSSYTPAGTIDVAVETHTNTPAGTVSQPTFTGNALGTHSHTAGTYAADATGTTAVKIGTAGATGAAQSHTHAISGSSQAITAGTPAGTVSQPTFTGTQATMAHNVTTKTFTGTADTTHLPPYYALCYIMRTE